MATEVSRTFDLQHGAVTLVVEDSFGQKSNHTLYLAMLDDVGTAVARVLNDTEAQAQLLRQRMVAAGWKPGQ